MSKHEWTVEQTQHGQRLDKFLTAQLHDTSRAQIQKWIAQGAVTVNGTAVSKHFAVQEGNVVRVQPVEVAVVTHEAIEIPVLYEDDDLLVINKPVGVLVHPAEQSNEWTIADFLTKHVPGIGEVGDSPVRPGIVHRLDRGVSGVMVVAKTQPAFDNLKAQFASRQVGKEYRAIVHGIPEKATEVIKFKIARSKTKGGKMAARPEHEDGREAWTEYDVLRTLNQRYAELKVTIKTGRTHQIRAHLAAIDHPVVGDTLYASKHYKSDHQYPRMFLHAERLSVTHPRTRERVEWVAPVPQQFGEMMHNV